MAPLQSPQVPWGVQVQVQPQSAALEHWVTEATHLVAVLLQRSPEGQGEVATQVEQSPTIVQVSMPAPAHWVSPSISTGQGSAQAVERQQNAPTAGPHEPAGPMVPAQVCPVSSHVPPASAHALPVLSPPVPEVVVLWVLLLLLVVVLWVLLLLVVVVEPPLSARTTGPVQAARSAAAKRIEEEAR